MHRLGPFAPLVLFLLPSSLLAQATPIVTVDGRVGKAVVTNTTQDTVIARVALWESLEGRPDGTVDLIAPARGRVWPDSVVLAPQGFQTVRILLDEGVYTVPTRLRLETLLTPLAPEVSQAEPAENVSARFVMEFRMLSRVEVTP